MHPMTDQAVATSGIAVATMRREYGTLNGMRGVAAIAVTLFHGVALAVVGLLVVATMASRIDVMVRLGPANWFDTPSRRDAAEQAAPLAAAPAMSVLPPDHGL